MMTLLREVCCLLPVSYESHKQAREGIIYLNIGNIVSLNWLIYDQNSKEEQDKLDKDGQYIYDYPY